MSIAHKIEELVERVLPAGTHADITVPENVSFGHYTTSVALKLAKQTGKSPHEVAEASIQKIKEVAPKDLFEKIEVAGPGFINFWLSAQTLRGELLHIAKAKKTYGTSRVHAGERVIVEYSQPNIAKKMHVGHLRSTIIGDALANMCKAVGYDVIRWNYLGDWGTQFGKLIAAYKLWGNREEVLRDPITTLLALYVRFHEEVKMNLDLEKRGAEEFKKLEEGDEENRKLWKWFRDESLKEFKSMYQLLGVDFDNWTGESAYEKDLTPLVRELLEKDIATKSEGAVIVSLEEKNLPPALIQKSDGASLYLTRDIVSLRERVSKYRAKRIVYVVGNEQALHFSQLFAIAEKLDIKDIDLSHAKFGLMLGEDGSKLSTREGKAIELRDLIEKLLTQAREVVKKKNPSLGASDCEHIAHAVAIGALKYNDLKENRMSDIVFDWKKMLNFSGNSGPYLQYTYARLQRVIKKAGWRIGKDFSFLETPGELSLIKTLLDFPSEVERAAETLFTSNFANYLYKLASSASRYYESTPILKDENKKRRNARLVLIECVAATLKNGLALLGIETPEQI